MSRPIQVKPADSESRTGNRSFIALICYWSIFWFAHWLISVKMQKISSIWSFVFLSLSLSHSLFHESHCLLERRERHTTLFTFLCIHRDDWIFRVDSTSSLEKKEEINNLLLMTKSGSDASTIEVDWRIEHWKGKRVRFFPSFFSSSSVSPRSQHDDLLWLAPVYMTRTTSSSSSLSFSPSRHLDVSWAPYLYFVVSLSMVVIVPVLLLTTLYFFTSMVSCQLVVLVFSLSLSLFFSFYSSLSLSQSISMCSASSLSKGTKVVSFYFLVIILFLR